MKNVMSEYIKKYNELIMKKEYAQGLKRDPFTAEVSLKNSLTSSPIVLFFSLLIFSLFVQNRNSERPRSQSGIKIPVWGVPYLIRTISSSFSRNRS